MKNVLIIQDVSSFGKCSTTVALPIISACGITGSILPTSLLSTHTGPEFPGFTFLDLFNNMKATLNHWEDLGIKFDAVYTGYLGRIEHVDLLIDHIPNLLKEDGMIFVDPAFADNGNFYPGFDEAYAKAQLRLVEIADYVFPNLSEACLMLGLNYNDFDESNSEDIDEVLKVLLNAGAKNALITGVRDGDKIGARLLSANGEGYTSLENFIPQRFHGTGDIFASVIVGDYMRSGDFKKAIDRAVHFVPEAIKATIEDENPITYGVHFEKVLHLLV